MSYSDQIHDLIGQSIEAEQSLLGALLLMPDSYLAASSFLRKEYFAEAGHAEIYRAIDECRQNGRRASISDIRQFLGSAVDLPMTEGMTVGGYLSGLAANATTYNAADYARTVRNLWALRRSVDITAEGGTGLPETRIKAIFDDMDALRVQIEEQAVNRAPIGEIGGEVLTQAAKIAGGKAGEPGISTGLPMLDHAMLGYRPGELIIVAGRPGMGKSTFATSSALASANTTLSDRRGGVGFFAFELGREAIGARCLADIASDWRDAPTHSAIRAGKISLKEQETLEDAARGLQKRSLIVDGRSSATVGEIEAACITMNRSLEKQGRRLNVVFIDYLKQVRATDRYKGNRVYEIGEITYGLRDMGKRLQIAVVLLVQLNRGVENRDDKRPTLADLRESGDIENDADVVALLYRPAYYLQRDLRSEENPDKQSALYHQLDLCKNDLEIILGKNRNGESEHTIKVFCDIGRSAIRPLSQDVIL